MKRLGFGALAILMAIAVATLWAGRAATTDNPTGPASTPEATPGLASASAIDETASATPPAPGSLGLLPETSNPNEYAAAVAGAVFAQDTVNADPEDYRARLMVEADPQMSPRGRSDLERMVAERIPSPEQWQRMRRNSQWSRWETEDVWQPGAWDEVVTSGQAEPGWVVRNVLGQQTVHFVDGSQARETSRERTLTIGMRCPAPGAVVDRCRLTLIGIGVVS